MGATAVALAKAAGYSNAGTVEFLLDGEGRYYFMEMNTRLQVEHPVTEMVTFIDLVRAQIHIAAGDPLHIKQEDVVLRGWSIEARINAEDPLRGFLPALGTLNRYIPPAGGGVRLDSCAYEGYTIPQQYDSMVAKLITFGRDRERAIAKMRRALDEFIVTGVRTTIPFHRFVFDHPVFVSGAFHTGFVEEHFSDAHVAALLRSMGEDDNLEHVALAAALQLLPRAHRVDRQQPARGPRGRPPLAGGQPLAQFRLFAGVNREDRHRRQRRQAGSGAARRPRAASTASSPRVGGREVFVELIERKPTSLTLSIDGHVGFYEFAREKGRLSEVVHDCRAYRVSLRNQQQDALERLLEEFGAGMGGSASQTTVFAPMPGKILGVNVQAGRPHRARAGDLRARSDEDGKRDQQHGGGPRAHVAREGGGRRGA